MEEQPPPMRATLTQRRLIFWGAVGGFLSIGVLRISPLVGSALFLASIICLAVGLAGWMERRFNPDFDDEYGEPVDYDAYGVAGWPVPRPDRYDTKRQARQLADDVERWLEDQS